MVEEEVARGKLKEPGSMLERLSQAAEAVRSATTPYDHNGRVAHFVDSLANLKQGGKVRIFDTELDPKFYNDVQVLRALALAKKEKDAKIVVISGPIIMTEPRVSTMMTFRGRGSTLIPPLLDDYLLPLRETGTVSTTLRRLSMQIQGPLTTVESFRTLVNQALLQSPEQQPQT